jgi:Na+-driven multidrug efflux pump
MKKSNGKPEANAHLLEKRIPNFRHYDIFDFHRMSTFFAPVLGFIAFQMSAGLPFVICGVMIGSLGDTLSLAVFGLGRTFTSMFFIAIINALNETLGVGASKLFGQKAYQKVGSLLWKTVLSILVLNVINAYLSYNSYQIMIMMSIEEEIAFFTSKFLVGSIPYIFLQGFNNAFVSFLSSQSLNKHFIYINCLSSIVVFFSAWHFIISMGMKHTGFLYAKVIQELFNMVCYVSIIVCQAHRETLILPNPFIVFRNITEYVVLMAKTVLCFYGEYIGFEITIYYVALLHQISELALYCSFVNFSILTFYVSCGIGNGFRALIGGLIGQRKFTEARRTSEQYFVYVFIITVVCSILILPFKYQIGYIYTGDDILSFKFAELLTLFCFLVYPSLSYNSALSMLRLLKMDNFLLKLSLVGYPSFISTISFVFCFGFGLGVRGIIIGVVVSRCIVFTLAIRKLYSLNWANPNEESSDQKPILNLE